MKTNEKKGGEGEEKKEGGKKYCGGYRARYRQFVAIRFFFSFYYFIYFSFFHRFFHHLVHIYIHTFARSLVVQIEQLKFTGRKNSFVFFYIPSLFCNPSPPLGSLSRGP